MINTTAIKMPNPGDIVRNEHNVSSRMWRKWDERARLMFNYLYQQGTDNKSVVHDLFDQSDENTEAIRVASWNLAFIAADFLRQQSNLSGQE